MLGFMATTAFLSMWISNTATTAMMMPIAQAVLAQLSEHHISAASAAESGEAGTQTATDQIHTQTDVSTDRLQSSDAGETFVLVRHAGLYKIDLCSYSYTAKTIISRMIYLFIFIHLFISRIPAENFTNFLFLVTWAPVKRLYL